MSTDQLNNIPTAQAKLGDLGRSSLYELLRSGELRSVKIGRRRFIPDSAIQEYLATLRQ